MQQGMKQNMVATAAMQQFMRALQATNMELRTLATQAMAANPALEELPPEEDAEDASTPDYAAAQRHDYLLDSLSDAPSLGAHLEEQVRRSALPARVEQAALELVQHLDERERLIIRLRFGLHEDGRFDNNGKELTQKEVADLLGISQSYISRLEKKIIRTLKNEIGANL